MTPPGYIALDRHAGRPIDARTALEVILHELVTRIRPVGRCREGQWRCASSGSDESWPASNCHCVERPLLMGCHAQALRIHAPSPNRSEVAQALARRSVAQMSDKKPTMRSIVFAAIVGACIASAAGASASEYELLYEAPTGSPSAHELRTSIDAHVQDKSRSSVIRIEISIVSSDDGFRGSLLAWNERGIYTARSVIGETCADVTRGMALIAGLAMDMSAIAAPEPSNSPPPPSPTPVPSAASVPSATGSTKAKPESLLRRLYDRPAYRLSATVSFDSSLGASMSGLGGQLGLHLSLPHHLSADIFSGMQAGQFLDGTRSMTFVGFRANYDVWLSSDAVAIELGAGPVLQWMLTPPGFFPGPFESGVNEACFVAIKVWQRFAFPVGPIALDAGPEIAIVALPIATFGLPPIGVQFFPEWVGLSIEARLPGNINTLLLN